MDFLENMNSQIAKILGKSKGDEIPDYKNEIESAMDAVKQISINDEDLFRKFCVLYPAYLTMELKPGQPIPMIESLGICTAIIRAASQ
jgi:hypothetical protein